MATNKKNAGFLHSAGMFVKSILHMFHGGATTTDNLQAIIDKGFEIAEKLHGSEMKPEIEATAREFLHALLQGQHVLNLTDQQLDNLVETAIQLAENFHKKE